MVALRKPIPQDKESFLESTAGQEWLAEATDDLLNRSSVTAPNAVGKPTVLVSFIRLTEALAEHNATQLDAGRCVEQILISIFAAGPTHPLFTLASRAVGGDDVVRNLAVELITPHADAYRDAAQEAERMIEECGF
ncbi:hypothetical protein ACIPL1_24930 [Pseudomonas sp. NPDC090202]|uniref:hypothetical protein n=1 Tax=Pseudomonas sp. NPDC090202 TaxID=3364476 RepID=UPI00381C6C09